jgi:dGTPase
VDDGVQAGLFHLKELLDVPLIGPILHQVFLDYPDLDPGITRLEAVRRMIGAMVDDVLAETRRRAERHGLASPEDVRMMGGALVAFSPDMVEDLSQLRAFLMERMYRHWRVNRTRSQARRILAEMFGLFMQEPDVLPTEWFARSKDRDEAGRARVVCDYIAGMTDRYAIEEHRRLFHLDVWN